MKKMNGKILTLEPVTDGLSAPPAGTCAQVARNYEKWLERRGFKQRSMRETNDGIFASNKRVLDDTP